MDHKGGRSRQSEVSMKNRGIHLEARGMEGGEMGERKGAGVLEKVAYFL